MRADDELAKQEFVTAEQLSKRQIILARRPKAKNELAHWFGKYYDKLNISFTKCERKAPKFIYGDISSLKNNDSISLFFIVLYF